MSGRINHKVAFIEWEDEEDKILSISFDQDAEVDAIELIEFRDANFMAELNSAVINTQFSKSGLTMRNMS
ncbi:MAG: hypothetical protein HRT71_05045 [Flavobacteriales bacterium]|nr:hypothetical protein [Flavobacteriales bacterium]